MAGSLTRKQEVDLGNLIMTHALKYPLFDRATLWVGAVALVLSLAVVPSAFAQRPGESAPMFAFDMDPNDGIDFAASAAGIVTLNRRPANNTMSWEMDADGLTEGHAWTLWVGNFEAGNDGGSASGGLVGGSGWVTTAGNHCIWPLVTEMDGGFRPGLPPDCDMVDVKKSVIFILMDHGKWVPGDVMTFWDPTGGDGNIPTSFTGFAMGFFPPLAN